MHTSLVRKMAEYSVTPIAFSHHFDSHKWRRVIIPPDCFGANGANNRFSAVTVQQDEISPDEGNTSRKKQHTHYRVANISANIQSNYTHV